jgi:hypothetical protein
MRGCLFMPNQKMLDLVLLVERIIDMQYCATRITKQAINTLVFEAADKYLSAGYFHLGIPLDYKSKHDLCGMYQNDTCINPAHWTKNARINGPPAAKS